MTKKLLIYCFLLLTYYTSFSTNYYTMGGGQWSTTAYTGPNNTVAPTSCDVGDTIFINTDDCTTTPSKSCAGNIPGAEVAGVDCYEFSFSVINGVVYIEDDGYLYNDGTFTINNTGKFIMKDNAYVFQSGNVITQISSSEPVLEVDDNAIFQWVGSFVLYRPIIGSGGIKCCGSLNITNIDGDSRYNGSLFGSTVAPTCGDDVLPVEISSFTIQSKEDKNVLRWTTIMEMDNAYFFVEKSINNEQDFYEVAFLESSAPYGTSNTPINYSYTDDNLSNKSAVYRLKQVDIDGKASFFYAESSTNTKNQTHEISVYPNPAHDEFTISSNTNNLSKIEIYNFEGKLFKTIYINNSNELLVSINENSNNIDNKVIIKSELPIGSYLLKVYDEDNHVTNKKLTIF